ncbi:MAG: hypothetical protein ACM3UU_06805 [Ignavibacteriales bacterium]
MNIEKITNDFLKTNVLSVSAQDITDNRNDKIIDLAVSRLLSKKYRKYGISEIVKESIIEKVTNIVSDNKPFKFIICFGGYKHWWTESYPNVDWAEMFNFRFLVDYILPIANAYKPGVIIEYESEEVVLERLNNIPQEDLDSYSNSFVKALEYYNKYLPQNVKLKFIKARELYDSNLLFREIEQKLDKFKQIFEGYDEEDKKRRLKKAQTNINWNGKVDLTKLSQSQKDNFIKESRIFNEAFLEADYELRTDYFEDKYSIPILLSFGLGPGGEYWLHIGSCSSSIVDFWAGMGIIEIREENKIIPRIISRTQYEKIKDKLIKVPVNNSDIANLNENFKYIYILNGKLDFDSTSD